MGSFPRGQSRVHVRPDLSKLAPLRLSGLGSGLKPWKAGFDSAQLAIFRFYSPKGLISAFCSLPQSIIERSMVRQARTKLSFVFMYL